MSSLQVSQVTGIGGTHIVSQGLDLNQEDIELDLTNFFHEESSIANSKSDGSLLGAGTSDSTSSHGATTFVITRNEESKITYVVHIQFLGK